MNVSSLYALAVTGSYKEADHMTFMCVHLSYMSALVLHVFNVFWEVCWGEGLLFVV